MKIKTIKRIVSFILILLISVAFSFSLFSYGDKVVTIRLSKYESQYLMKLIDSCFCDNGESHITDSIKSQIKGQQ